MKGTIAERIAAWDAFLQRWPLERLSEMQLSEYSTAGDQDCFVYWLEKRTEDIGSIWGGSAFKFGVYARKNRAPHEDERGRKYSEKFGWLQAYGESPEEAFERVRGEILRIGQAARSGNLQAIDKAELGPAVRWKVAFLYQSREAPCVFPIFKLEYLQAALNSKEKEIAVLQGMLAKRQGNKSVLEFGDELWSQIQDKISVRLTLPQARQYLDESGRFTLVKQETSKIAGYESGAGRQLALALDNKGATIYLSDGPWLASVRDQLEKVFLYSPDAPRSSNLAANAPQLAIGNSILRVVVPNVAALIALCDAYDDTDTNDNSEMGPTSMGHTTASRAPLNQILYGPPGTGKTYATVDAALKILDPAYLAEHCADRTSIKARFDQLMDSGHVKFVTFHQSFSYEDFVEGLRADTGEDGQLRYEVVDGIFKSLCEAAASKVTQQAESPIDLKGRRLWKMSLGNTQGGDSYIYEECITNGYALLGWGGLTDFTGCIDHRQIYDRYSETVKDTAEGAYAVRAVSTFVLKMKIGDLIIVNEGKDKFRAIGEITGNYRYLKRDDQSDGFYQCRDVKWLRVYKPALPYDQLLRYRFTPMALYEIGADGVEKEQLAALLGTKISEGDENDHSSPFKPGETFGQGYEVLKCSSELVELIKPTSGSHLPIALSQLHILAGYVRDGRISLDDIREKRVFEKVPETKLEKNFVNGYNNIVPLLVERILDNKQSVAPNLVVPLAANAKVLIIDEINRGNVSRILGELITLIEPSKRAGMPEALEVTLPYSKDRFSVPSNLYLIGTMNTADRSLSGLDIALRRRFDFREMPPRPDLLNGVEVEGINVGALLRVMNERIELLLDRDHCLGHAYFMPLCESATLNVLAQIFRANILPLLQEYFFEDWQRIQWVLNDHRKAIEYRFLNMPSTDFSKLFGEGVSVSEQSLRWTINDSAFYTPQAYSEIIG